MEKEKLEKEKCDCTVEGSWLWSDNFLKRCFAVWGHFFTAHLLLLLIVFVILLLFGVW